MHYNEWNNCSSNYIPPNTDNIWNKNTDLLGYLKYRWEINSIIPQSLVNGSSNTHVFIWWWPQKYTRLYSREISRFLIKTMLYLRGEKASIIMGSLQTIHTFSLVYRNILHYIRFPTKLWVFLPWWYCP